MRTGENHIVGNMPSANLPEGTKARSVYLSLRDQITDGSLSDGESLQGEQRLLPLLPPTLLQSGPQDHHGVGQNGAELAAVVRQLRHGQPEVQVVRLRQGQIRRPRAYHCL